MSFLPETKSKDLVKLLIKLGFSQRNRNGSHVVFSHLDGRRTVIPIHNKPLKTGTLRAILRQIDLEVTEFIKLIK